MQKQTYKFNNLLLEVEGEPFTHSIIDKSFLKNFYRANILSNHNKILVRFINAVQYSKYKISEEYCEWILKARINSVKYLTLYENQTLTIIVNSSSYWSEFSFITYLVKDSIRRKIIYFIQMALIPILQSELIKDNSLIVHGMAFIAKGKTFLVISHAQSGKTTFLEDNIEINEIIADDMFILNVDGTLQGLHKYTITHKTLLSAKILTFKELYAGKTLFESKIDKNYVYFLNRNLDKKNTPINLVSDAILSEYDSFSSNLYAYDCKEHHFTFVNLKSEVKKLSDKLFRDKKIQVIHIPYYNNPHNYIHSLKKYLFTNITD